ncbi:MAG: ATP-binding cassette domain-containing protein [Enterocloster citroniae]|nr:ATP-binding cassette domain-containing protein [Enterocloster citroniae]
MREEVYRMERVTYCEQGVALLENFSMAIWTGEILGLVPANHFGLSALLRLLRQNLPLHYGFVYYKERLVNDWRFPCTGMNRVSTNRVSIIQNQSCLAKDLTVADNIFVLRPGFRKRLMQPGILREQIKPFMEDIGMEIPADAYIEDLSTFERFVVELLKAVVAGNHLVVLEDISTFISAAELEKLSRILRHYAKQGMSFLYVAAHFEEAQQICDRAALMLNGQIIKCFGGAEKPPDPFFLRCTEDFDRHVRERMARQDRTETGPDHIVFRMENLCSGLVENLSFSACKGECLVVQDLDNCMIQELVSVLSGGTRQKSGSIWINGTLSGGLNDRRVGIIQELPVHTMLFPNMSYLDNLCFTLDHRMKGVWGRGKIKKSLRREYAGLLGEDVFDTPIERLTERQKYDLIYTRIFLQDPDIVFCVQPFKSAEVSLRIHIMELLERFLNRGIPVVIMAVNLADSLALADRLLRVGRGGTVQEYCREEFAALPVNTPWLYLYQEGQGEGMNFQTRSRDIPVLRQ